MTEEKQSSDEEIGQLQLLLKICDQALSDQEAEIDDLQAEIAHIGLRSDILKECLFQLMEKCQSIQSNPFKILVSETVLSQVRTALYLADNLGKTETETESKEGKEA